MGGVRWKAGSEDAGGIGLCRACFVICCSGSEVIVVFFTGIETPDEFLACARSGINHSYGLVS